MLFQANCRLRHIGTDERESEGEGLRARDGGRESVREGGRETGTESLRKKEGEREGDRGTGREKERKRKREGRGWKMEKEVGGEGEEVEG